MATNGNRDTEEKKIVIEYAGPYQVHGNIPLVRKIQIVSEHGEPLTWKKEGTIETKGKYDLCRCGQSRDKPICDATHCEIDFDSTETADTATTATRQETLGGAQIVVKRDTSLCSESGFCGTRFAKIEKLVAETNNTDIRSQVIAMIERCPSGSLTYALTTDPADIEPDLPQQIAVTTEITAEGPIDGPLWVTGNIPIERSDGQPLETRNRVTLCSCGRSKNKPLCDGAHRLKKDESQT